MLSLPPSVRIFVACEPVDLRRGSDGLAGAVCSIIREDPDSRAALAAVDAALDRCLGAMVEVARAAGRALEPGDPTTAASEAFLEQFFPEGAQAITGLPYTEQREACEAILPVMASEAWRPQVELLGLTRYVARATALLPTYGALVDATTPARAVAWAEVQAARVTARRAFLSAIAWVLAYVDEAAAESLLAPLQAQIDAVVALARSRSREVDVAPETGEPEAPAESAVERATEAPVEATPPA